MISYALCVACRDPFGISRLLGLERSRRSATLPLCSEVLAFRMLRVKFRHPCGTPHFTFYTLHFTLFRPGGGRKVTPTEVKDQSASPFDGQNRANYTKSHHPLQAARQQKRNWVIGGLEDWGIGGLGDWGIGGFGNWGIGAAPIENTVRTKSYGCCVVKREERKTLQVPECFRVSIRREPTTSVPLTLEQRPQPNLPEIANRTKESHLRF